MESITRFSTVILLVCPLWADAGLAANLTPANGNESIGLGGAALAADAAPLSVGAARDLAEAVFEQVRFEAEQTLGGAITAIGSVSTSSIDIDFPLLLNSVFQPIVEETRSIDLKGALPSAAWLFLSGMLTLLGLQKRAAVGKRLARA
ncbi:MULTISPECIES: hypothetical protein [unclassified Methylomonas]|uniref:hypothetical protein n=1 Tax=unclassified Methylomonas TaxID=2608980 RepID=UPI0008DAC2F7|nr:MULTISPECIES: hypothetical protein [unclassified Methylomonas]MDT4331892.1 hypothetical protein [Methylomonas sp. MV1]NJA04546.1 hypothetical protein [Methylococcaceae bacterium WWC4]OHX35737.1 hypothetical protein BJL95_16110 [Methylomonas sp. LWB]